MGGEAEEATAGGGPQVGRSDSRGPKRFGLRSHVTPTIRPVTREDTDAVQLALYLAVTWDAKTAPPPEIAVQHPELRFFWEDWGRLGDVGVVAECDSNPVGAAFGRLFTEQQHSHGFVDEETPEICIGIIETSRGTGLGRRLMVALHDEASAQGIETLSLSVNITNPALGLYRSLGYQELDRDDDSIRMLKSMLAR